MENAGTFQTVSRFFGTLKKGKLSIKASIFTFSKGNFELSQNLNAGEKNTVYCKGVWNFNYMSGKLVEFCYFKFENGHFLSNFHGFLKFPNFQVISDFVAKKYPRVIFTFLTKNWPKNMIHITQSRNFQLGLLTYWPWVTWTLNMLSKSLR